MMAWGELSYSSMNLIDEYSCEIDVIYRILSGGCLSLSGKAPPPTTNLYRSAVDGFWFEYMNICMQIAFQRIKQMVCVNS